MLLREAMRLLETKLGAVIDCEALHPAFAESDALQLSPDQYHHHGSYCRRRKFTPGGMAGCAANKERSKEVAAYGREFHGCCPFGVWDCAAPVLLDGRLAAILYVGYGREPGSPGKEARRAAAAAARWLRELVRLELEQWKMQQFLHPRKKRDETYYLEQARRFIDRRYPFDPSLSDLAEMLHVNENYLGGVIRHAAGCSFREMLLATRLREAELLLIAYRSMPVGEVANRCGFRDGNYFSTVFSRKFGCSPRDYRRRK